MEIEGTAAGKDKLAALVLDPMVLLLLLGLALLYYVSYYRRRLAGRPEVICRDPERRKVLEEHCPALFQTFHPTIWAPQAHMQTVGRAVLQTFRVPEHPRRR